APHQAPPEFIEKYRGRFDAGWDVIREQWYKRQLEMGVISEGTELAPRNPGVEPWDELSENEKRFACRLQEAFAGFLDHTDHHIGRLVSFLKEMGDLDNTIIVLLSDNGASQEGGATGLMDEAKYFMRIPEDPTATLIIHGAGLKPGIRPSNGINRIPSKAAFVTRSLSTGRIALRIGEASGISSITSLTLFRPFLSCLILNP
ncbi:MAG: sulfatase-like hydrolase/transferase, partial [Deltaproteobacteria bacterium]|nr:sulfatase-like hydrolase/transferase [Deltaproteobacteria bacterium]